MSPSTWLHIEIVWFNWTRLVNKYDLDQCDGISFKLNYLISIGFDFELNGGHYAIQYSLSRTRFARCMRNCMPKRLNFSSSLKLSLHRGDQSDQKWVDRSNCMLTSYCYFSFRSKWILISIPRLDSYFSGWAPENISMKHSWRSRKMSMIMY